jgi:hypothetical protein
VTQSISYGLYIAACIWIKWIMNKIELSPTVYHDAVKTAQCESPYPTCTLLFNAQILLRKDLKFSVPFSTFVKYLQLLLNFL